MRIKIALGSAVFLWVASMAGLAVAKDYPVGTKFTDLFRIDYSAARKTVPLPPGEWKLVSQFEFQSGASNITIVRYYLLRHSEKRVTGAIRIVTHKELVNFQWGASKSCSPKRQSAAWYYKNDVYDSYEHCDIAYPLRGFNRRSKSLKKVYEYIDGHGLKGPNGWISINFARVQKDEMMQAYYALPPEHYGFARERKYSNAESPWAINNIHDHPKKKAFMDKAVTWIKSWQKLIDQGFDNNLRVETVRAHPRIDGMAAPPRRQAPIAAKPVAPPVESSIRVAKRTPPPKPQVSDGPLKPDQLRKLIAGKTAFGQGTLSDSRVIFDGRGKLDGRSTQGNTDYEDYGRWSIDSAGKLCLDWDNEEFTSDSCFRTMKKGARILMQDDTGDTVFVLAL